MELQQLVALVLFLAVYAAFTSPWVHRAVAALAGAVVLVFWAGPGPVVSAMVPDALLVTGGLMVVAGALRRSGLAAWLALHAAKAGRGRPVPILILLSLLSFLLGALVGPAAAVVLVVPVALVLAVELDLDSLPFLATLSWSGLLGGAALMTAQPANLWVVSALGLAPGDWAVKVAPLALAAEAATLIVAIAVFRGRLRVTNERRARVLEYDAAKSLGEPKAVIQTVAALVLVAAGFLAAAQGLPVSPSAVALLAAVILMVWDRRDGVSRALGDIDGPVLVFYAGLFAVVAAWGASGLPAALARSFAPSGPVLLAGSALLGALVDHGAVLGAFIPFLKSWVLGGPASLWVYAVLGTSIGAGITVWGSASVATALGLAGSGRHTPDWKQFTVYGLVFGAVNLLVVGVLGALLLR